MKYDHEVPSSEIESLRVTPVKRKASEAIHVMVTPADKERYEGLAERLNLSMRDLVVMGLEQVWKDRSLAELDLNRLWEEPKRWDDGCTERAVAEDTTSGDVHTYVHLLYKRWLSQDVRIARLETALRELCNEIAMAKS